MESDITQSEGFYRAWAWLETNKKLVGWAVAAILLVAFVAWFVIWRQNEKEVTAAEALSRAFVAQATGSARPDPQAYMQVTARYPNSSAAARALLLAAGTLFTEGKYADAQTEFSRFIREHRDSSLMAEALLGVAACLDAQGKTDQAITAYKDLIDHHPGENVLPPAKVALARLYEAQNKIELARNLYEDVTRGDPQSSIVSEAGMRLEELRLKYPPPATPAAPVTLTPAPKAPVISNAGPLTLTPSPTAVPTSNSTPFTLSSAPKGPALSNTAPAAAPKR